MVAGERASAVCAAVAVAMVVFTLVCVDSVNGIGCFVCTSTNNRNPACEDTFNNTSNFYQADCMAGRKGRNGYFPATHCVKMIAENDTHKIVVRQCVVDNGDINSETEIGRSTHCYMVRWVTFNDKLMKGCVLSCDTDGCNSAHVTTPRPLTVILTLMVSLHVILKKTFIPCN